MTKLLITGATIYKEKEIIEQGDVLIEHGKIAAVSSVPLHINDATNVMDGTGHVVLPGFIDGHIHGTNGADTMDATSEALETIARALPEEGTTSFLATTMTDSLERINCALENVATYQQKNNQAEILGVHLEGPFIHPNKKGAQREAFVLPASTTLFKHWQEAAQGFIKMVTIAPECDNDGLIPYLHEKGILVSAGHTNATYAEMKVAVVKGVRQVTHLANAMSGIHHREVGVVGAAFLMKQLSAEIIADGIHLSPEMLEIMYRQLGRERMMLITDGIRAKGLQDGMYELGGQHVQVKNGCATLRDGSLAGSIVTMIDAVHMMLKIPHVTLADIVQMTAVNPAKQLQIFDRKGSIEEGKDADIVMLDDTLNIKYTICRGDIAYKEGNQWKL